MAWTSSTVPRTAFGLADAVERTCAAGFLWRDIDRRAWLERIGFAGWLRGAVGLHLAVLAVSLPDMNAGASALLTGLLVAALACVPAEAHALDGLSNGGCLRTSDREPGWPEPRGSASHINGSRPGHEQPPRAPRPQTEIDAWAELSARISHDLRTPLNAIIGFSEMMDAEILGPVGNPRYREYLAHIRDSGVMLLKSTEDTLALIEMLGRAETASRGRGVDLSCLVREVAAPSTDLSRLDEAEVIGERRVLRQIVVNLLGAARQYAGSNGQVSVSARCEGSRVVLAVRVSGEPPLGPTDAGRFPLCLARTLLDMQGAQLIEGASTGEAGELTGWQAVTVLDRAVQADFFK